jgi:hypothetical protein
MSLEDEDARARDDRKKRKERGDDAHELKIEADASKQRKIDHRYVLNTPPPVSLPSE